MLNSSSKKEALNKLKKSHENYALIGKKVEEQAENLLSTRLKVVELLKKCEGYISKIANKPKSFHKEMEELRIEMKKFDAILNIEYDSKKADATAGGMAGAGVAAAAGVAAFGPTAAMAIATTFGTASTGTAISALSGAAATNAALAWLGGGALVAGGGGMAAGNALLALAGPIGWTIGGVALGGSMLFANKKNKEIAAKADKERFEVEKQTAILKATKIEIKELIKQTKLHLEHLQLSLEHGIEYLPNNYLDYTTEQKKEIGTLVNNTVALSKLLNQKIGERS